MHMGSRGDQPVRGLRGQQNAEYRGLGRGVVSTMPMQSAVGNSVGRHNEKGRLDQDEQVGSYVDLATVHQFAFSVRCSPARLGLLRRWHRSTIDRS
jgi:hypothetical protein